MSDDNPPVDHVIVDEEGGAAPIQEHLKSRPTWIRFVFMLVFYVLAGVTSLVTSFVVALGFLWVLFTGERNEQLQKAGAGIASYLYQIVQYLTYNSDERPFPFDAKWPSAEPDGSEE